VALVHKTVAYNLSSQPYPPCRQKCCQSVAYSLGHTFLTSNHTFVVVG